MPEPAAKRLKSEGAKVFGLPYWTRGATDNMQLLQHAKAPG
jgi:hypothetical protein